MSNGPSTGKLVNLLKGELENIHSIIKIALKKKDADENVEIKPEDVGIETMPGGKYNILHIPSMEMLLSQNVNTRLTTSGGKYVYLTIEGRRVWSLRCAEYTNCCGLCILSNFTTGFGLPYKNKVYDLDDYGSLFRSFIKIGFIIAESHFYSEVNYTISQNEQPSMLKALKEKEDWNTRSSFTNRRNDHTVWNFSKHLVS